MNPYLAFVLALFAVMGGISLACEVAVRWASWVEARADWDDARRLRARVRNAAMFEGRWVA